MTQGSEPTEVSSGSSALHEAEMLQKLSIEALQLLNDDLDFHDSLKQVVQAIKRGALLDAVGLRLRSGDDFPYFVEEGFSRDFLRTENSIVEHSADGDICRDKSGRPCFECTCGLVVSGCTETDSPVFTPGGSFWINQGNASFGFPHPHDDPRLNARNRCLQYGYLSVALVPVRAHQEIVGLLQLNARAPGRFDRGIIEFFEGLSAGIGLALMRKRAQDALRNSEAQYRLLFTQMTEGFALHEMICDAQGRPVDYRFLDANPAFERLTGVKAADAIGSTVRTLLPDTEPAWIENYGKVASSGESLQYEGYAADLKRHFRVVAFSPRKGQFATLFEDITERKQRNERLRLLYATVDVTADGAYWMDVEGRFVFVNASACKMLGYSRDELLNMRLFDVNPLVTLEKWTSLWQTIRERKYLSVDSVHRRKDGSEFPVEIASTYVELDGNEYINGFARDITERKRADEALRDQQVELERFTYAVSHDLKSPLVTIKTFLCYLEQDLSSADGAAISKDLGYIHNAADKMSELLVELLKLSRVGRMTAPAVELPLQTIVQEAAALVAGRFAARGVTLVVSEQPVVLFGDPRRLVELFQNLLDNAAKFTGTQPAPRIEVGVEAVHDEWVLFVRDNGIGFEMQHQDRLFGLFERLDSTTEGTGIGLTLVRRIVQLHGGRIWATSDGPGLGATFRLTLRRTRVAADRTDG